MRKYTDFVFATGGGGAIPGATVTVNISGGGLATLYSDEGITAIENPVLSDENGKFEFYVADGSYDISIYDGTGTQTITDVQIYDESTFAYSGANGDITSLTGVTGGIASPDYIQFDTGAGVTVAQGQVAWNSADGTVDIGMGYDGVVQQVGLENYFRIKADAAITNGDCIMFTGAVGASGVLKGAPSTGVTVGQYIMGVATMDIAHNGFGYVTSFGLVRGINTTGSSVGETWADGDVLYYNPAYTGGLTKTPPTAPLPKVIVAAVVNAGSVGSGSLFIRVQAEPDLHNLSDVYAPSPISDGQLLIGDTAQSRWESATLTAGTNIAITNGAGSVTISAIGSAGSGDVVGPATATNNALALFDGTTGRLLKDSGVLLTAKAASGANSDITSLSALSTPLSVAQGGSGANTLTGIVKGNGTSAFTAVTAPSGTIVGTTDTQTLSGKTLTGTKETVFAITDGASVDIDPANGGIQTWTLGANRTPTATNFAAGQSVMLMIADGTAYAVTWSSIGVVWVGGTAPTLPTSGYGIIELWKVGSTIYGASVGDVA